MNYTRPRSHTRAGRRRTQDPVVQSVPYIVGGVILLGAIILLVIYMNSKPARGPAPAAQPGVVSTEVLLEKADAEFQTAQSWLGKSGPDAPGDTRPAAAKESVKHLKECQTLYEVLTRGLSPAVRQRVEERLHDVQQSLYWSRKFSGV